MAQGSELHAVISTEERIPHNRVLANALSKSRGIHRLDAMYSARKRNYVFDSECTPPQANVLSAELEKEGVASVVVPMGYFTELRKALRITNANCLGAGFEIEPLNVPPFSVEWSDVAMISCARVEMEEDRRPSETDRLGRADAYVMKTGRRMHTTVLAETLARRAPARHQRPVHDCLDIFIGRFEDDKFAAHLRVIAAEFCYDYLDERKQLTSSANFRLFIADIIRYAPHVALTGRTRAFLDNAPIGRPFAGYRVFEEYTYWSVALARATSGKA